MLLAVRISSYGCTWEVWRALKKLELLSAAPRATLTFLSCSPNFPRASITRDMHAKHEPVLNENCIEWFSYGCRKVIGFALTTLGDWLKRFAPLFHPIRSKTKTNCVIASRTLRQLPVIMSSFDWFTVLSVFFVIG